MRCLFIRHGLSRSNLRDIRSFIRIAKESRPPEDFEALVEEMLKGEAPNEYEGDTELSEAGLEEAEQLGRHWVELLQGNAASGRVRVFVSPMRRCMQTIDPLMRKLGAIGATVPATVLTAIHEQPGLLHPVDKRWVRDIVQPLANQGKAGEARALELLRARQYVPCGSSSSTLKADFPWATEFDGFPTTETMPWYDRGRESRKQFEARADRVVDLIHRLQHELDESDLVIFVSHGDFLDELLVRLLGAASGVKFSLMNTSTTSLKFPKDGGCVLEFVNRTEHLNTKRNVQLYQSMEIMEKRTSSGKRYMDIGQVMRSQKFFDTPVGKLTSKL